MYNAGLNNFFEIIIEFFLMQPTFNAYQSLFYCKLARANISYFPLDTSCSVRPPTEAEGALGVVGWQVVQLFHHANIVGFLLPL
jgi:hypothetical protein